MLLVPNPERIASTGQRNSVDPTDSTSPVTYLKNQSGPSYPKILSEHKSWKNKAN